MTKQYFPRVDRWRLLRLAVEMSLQELALDGRGDREGIVLWLGHRGQGVAEITTLAALHGPSLMREWDVLRIDADLMNRVTDAALQLGLTLVGQIHSHPPGYGVDLSLVDREYGFKVPGYLSVVAPDFGLRPGTTLDECGVHVFELGTGYRRLSRHEAHTRIEVVDGPVPTFLPIGKGAP
jgi:proteasome lid subunit RPN8/RPN11